MTANDAPFIHCAGNACFVSVARQADVDPGNMDEMLALRTSLREVQGAKRRRVARQARFQAGAWELWITLQTAMGQHVRGRTP